MPEEGNEIILGVYPPDLELADEIINFGIQFDQSKPVSTPIPTLDNSSESLPVPTGTPKATSYYYQANSNSDYYQVPGFGEIPSEGFGFILLRQEGQFNKLYVLADSQENGAALLKT